MESFAIKPKQYLLLSIPLLLVYILGLLVPLMDEDPSHHADIALQMYLSDDYIHLISKGKDYLDKPHLLFWSTAAFYHVFGVTTLAYKLPSFLVSALGIYATFRLGKLLYSAETGVLAALITASAHAFILSNNDVRMDAMLTGFIIFATWQLCEAVLRNKWKNYFWGAVGMALAFSTKGMIGVAMPAVAIFFFIVYRRDWKKLFSLKWIFALVVLLAFISPVLYCYYVQFDLHPEKVIRGRSGISGLKFILWDQSVERFEGTNFGKGRVKPFFFMHTMLWAFLPWAFMAYYAVFSRLQFFLKTRFRYVRAEELLTVSTVLGVFILLSSAHYQLPHYLNILFPFLGIITARELLRLHSRNPAGGILVAAFWFQLLLTALMLLVAILLNTWLFPLRSIGIIAVSFFLLLVMIHTWLYKYSYLAKIVLGSALAIIVVNVLMNGNFYPQLLQYQSGPVLARILRQQKADASQVYKFNTNSYSFDFYAARIFPFISLQQIENKAGSGQDLWLYTNSEGKEQLLRSGVPFKLVSAYGNARITKLKPKFLNPKTRQQACYNNYLLRVSSRIAAK